MYAVVATYLASSLHLEGGFFDRNHIPSHVDCIVEFLIILFLDQLLTLPEDRLLCGTLVLFEYSTFIFDWLGRGFKFRYFSAKCHDDVARLFEDSDVVCVVIIH
jgi:hypothetical protein